MKEYILSWNFANFVSVTLMLAIIWLIVGGTGHLLRGGKSTSDTTGEGFGKTTGSGRAVQAGIVS